MKDKPFKTYTQLVEKLKKEKKLTVPDEARVIELLKKHSYFSLVSGYKRLFKQKNGEYRPGTTIEDLLALFEFDNRLRDIFFHDISMIEKHIKSLLSHAFVEKYGDDQEMYLTPSNYAYMSRSSKDTYFRCGEVARLIRAFREIVTPPFSHRYIEHQWTKHNNIPLWVAIKAVTLGTTSKMYSLCTQDVQAAVSLEFSGVRERQLVSMLDFLTQVRNVCAHNERLYDFTNKKRAIQAMPLHMQLKISKDKKKKNSFQKGQSDLFAAMVCFKYLLSKEEFLATATEIEWEIKKLCRATKQIQESKILSCMGFPLNWYDSVRLPG